MERKAEQKKSVPIKKRESLRLKENIFICGRLNSNPTPTHTEFKAITGDISSNGLMFEFEKEIPLRSKLEVYIYQPISFDKKMLFFIPVFARTAWIKQIEKDNFEEGENRYKVGIEFLRIKDDDREKITRFISGKRK
ncbi:MAG: PilZ domain-containing protein [bacterium]